MSASVNGRALTNGEFVCVIDGVTYVGRAQEWNYSQTAFDMPTCTLGGVITASGPWGAQPEAAPAPVEPEVPQPRLRVHYVDYNNLPVRGEEDCLYVIAPREVLGAGVELPCAYVYRPTDEDGSTGMLNTLPYKPTNISARLLRSFYAHGDRFPGPRQGRGHQLMHRVAGDRPTWSMGLLLFDEHVFVAHEMVCVVTGPTLAARSAILAQARDTDVHPTEAPAVDEALQLTVQILPWSQLPVVGDHDTLYCVSGPTGGEGRAVFEENAYVYRPAGSDDPHPYKATSVSATTVARVHNSGDRLPHGDAIARDLAPVCYVTSASTVPREVRTRTGFLAWLPIGWRATGEIPTRARPGHLVLPSASSAAAAISVPQVSPQTARDIMTRGWGTSLASTTLVEELPTHLPLPPTDVAVPGNLVREQYPITFVPRDARELADQMMTEVNDAVAAEADRQFSAALNAATDAELDRQVVAALTSAAAEALVTRTIIVRHVSHHDLLPEVGSTNSLYCVFGYPMAFLYRVNERSRSSMSRWVTTGYFPTNISAAEIAPVFNDGEGLLCELNNTEQAIGSHAVLVRIAVDTESTRSVGFQTNRLNVLTHGPGSIWTAGPWFHRRTTLAPVDHGPNRNGDDFTNAVGTFDRISLPRIQGDGVFQRVYPTVRQTFPAPDLPNLDQPASAAPASSPPSAPARRLILD